MRQDLQTKHVSTSEASLLSAKLVRANEYLPQLASCIDSARYRVSLATLLLGYDHETSLIFDALERAIRRGVQVTLAVDEYYSKLYYFGRFSHFNNAIQRLDRLASLGAAVTSCGSRSVDPFRGRCHAKISVVDNLSYCFGGMNLASKAARNVDYMLLVESRSIADYLDQTVLKLAAGDGGRDGCFRLNRRSSILVDWGMPGQSEIYASACRMIYGAARVYFVSQFGPTGPLARLLESVETKYYFNRSLSSNLPLGVMLAVDKLISGARTVYRGSQYLHAKLIVAQYPDGSMSVLSGSHNFKNQGVRNGTAEIALLSSEPAVCDLMLKYIQGHLVERHGMSDGD